MASIDSYRTRLAHGEEVVFTQPRGRMILFLLGCIVFALIGLGMIFGDGGIGATIGGWAAVLFFGVLGIPSMLLKAIRPSPQLRVSADQGVWLAQGDASWLSWPEIETVIIGEVSGQKMVALAVDQDLYDRRFAESSAATRALAAANATIVGGPGLAIPTNLSIKPAVLADWLTVEHQERVPSARGTELPPSYDR